MRKYLIILLLLMSFKGVSHNKDSLEVSKLRFHENKGQWDSRIIFKADLNYGYLQCLQNELRFVFFNPEQYSKLFSNKLLPPDQKVSLSNDDFLVDYHAYAVNFINSNKKTHIIPENPASDYSNYYLGNDPARWADHVKNFDFLRYVNLYNNIDLELTEADHLFKYQFVVKQGGNPKDIVMEYQGTEKMFIQQENLIIKTSVIQITELSPFAYQIIDGKKHQVSCKFSLHKNKVRFELPESYDKNYDLIIDPTLIFSTFSGSLADNWGFTATYDDLGNTYSGGICFNDIANGYPVTPGAFQVNFAGGEGNYSGGCDVAIIKYSPTGINRIYATYIGGSKNDLPHSTIVDLNGNLLLYGTTGSPDFPMTANAYDMTFNGGSNVTYDNVLTFMLGVDMYVSKLSPDGSQLLSSTYLGGTNNDGLNLHPPLSHNYADGARGEINIDQNNNVYIVSTTASTDYPVTSGAFQTTFSGGLLDGCITKLDNNLHSVIWSSFLGGSDLDAVYGIVVDDNSDIYVCGGTSSSNFPTTSGAYQTAFNGGTADGFITKISGSGNNILNSTYYGSAFYDQIYLMDRSKQGYVFVYGQTSAPGSVFIHNAAWNFPGGGQFITKFYPSLNTRYWSTAFGSGLGGPDISPTAFLVDLCSKIYLSGWGGVLNGSGGTNGLPISANAFQPTTDNNDFYLLVIKDDASAMDYGTYFGGPFSREHVDGGTSRFDRKGKIYQSVCAGCGGYDDFPTTPGAWSIVNNSSNCNNGTFKFDFLLPVTIADFQLPPVVCLPNTVNFINNSYSGGTGLTYWWDFGDGSTSTLANPTHSFTSSGVYNVTLIATDNGTCNFSDTTIKQILVLSNTRDTLPSKNICLGQFSQIGIPPTGDPSVSFSWSPTSFLSDPTICNPFVNPPNSTTYTLLVTNGFCTDTLVQQVIVYDLDAYPGNDTTTCTGTITLTADSSQDANIFHWSSNPLFTDWLNSPSSNPSFTTTITGPTTFYIQIDNGYCTAIDSVTVTFEVVLDTFSYSTPSCYGDCDGWATIYALAGTPPFSYNWSNGNTNDTIINLCAGTYTVTITDAHQCISVSSINLPEPDPMLGNPIINHIPCETACIGSISLNTTGGTPPYSYSWSNGQTSSTISGLCAGSYAITITDQEQCVFNDSYAIIIDYIFENVNVYSDKDTIYQGQSTGLHATLIPNVTYTWVPPTGLDDPSSPNPVASPDQTTVYILTLSDPNGCIYSDTLKITVLEVFCDEPYIYVPNAFTPDGDGKNDVVYVRSKMITDMNFFVYDRWGEKVFESHDQSNGWNGTFKGKNCDPGVFVYFLEATCHNKKNFLKKGNITLIK